MHPAECVIQKHVYASTDPDCLRRGLAHERWSPLQRRSAVETCTRSKIQDHRRTAGPTRMSPGVRLLSSNSLRSGVPAMQTIILLSY